ncbi:MAG: 50S ribosomal protein L9 [Fimbriimonadaceae bacterium]|nr:50S ribosomal protein L9 [Fimbriimonadaceae bacterium]
MKVILKTAVPKVGKAGQVVNVKPGFARNFLFPQGMATVADKGQMKALDARNARLSAQLADTKAAAEKVADVLNGQTLKIEGNVGAEQGKLFGAITSQDIADRIAKEFGQKVEKKDIALLQPIKRTGKYPIEVDIHRDVPIHMTVVVFDPNAIEEPKAEEAAVAAETAEPAKAEEAPAEEATEEVSE